MKTQSDLMQLGIPTYTQSIFVDVPTGAENVFGIGKQMPTQMGWIYGISIYVDGVTPDNVELITFADAVNLFFEFVDGMSSFIKYKRLSEFVCYDNPGSIYQTYIPVSIPGSVDLSQSIIHNPQQLTAGADGTQIMINLHYVDWTSYTWLVKKKYITPMRQLENPNDAE